MKVKSIFRLSYVAAFAAVIALVAVQTAGAITAATADKKNPAGTTYSGAGVDAKKETSQKEAKQKSYDKAEKACEDYCKPNRVCNRVIAEPGEPTCSDTNDDPKKERWECKLSAKADDANHGCKLESCVCCSFVEGDPILNLDL